ncbi:DnaD domain protein [Heliorestis acidaminivorans]|uniref:DnaD domain protein n=1 Tax=Heliorestis acidaminivorans TaxID=553427 RepID=A0A6I0F5C8_9FIRM|nr:DnaD domain protein [Heliorestis acidaminivorans]KAB2953877.1 DnaD domain protein [Heliorestis acidaminivorans]
MTLAHWLQSLWEKGVLHLHKLLYHSKEELQLSNETLQALLVIEEKIAVAGEKGIQIVGLQRHVADSIAHLKKSNIIEIECEDGRAFISFAPLFAKLLQQRGGQADLGKQYLQMHEEIQEEIRRLDDLRNRQVLERNQLTEDRKALTEKEERFHNWEEDLRQKEKEMQEELKNLLQEEKRIQEQAFQLREEKLLLDKERIDLNNLRRELKEVKAYLDQQSASQSRSSAPLFPQENDAFSQLASFLQQQRGQGANQEEIREIEKMQQRYRWSLDFTMLFLRLSFQKGHRTVTEYRRQAELVYQRGIERPEKLEEYFEKKSYFDEKISEVWVTLGSSIRINDIFIDVYKKWSQTWGFSHEVILRACQETYKGAQNPNLNYVDVILTRWRQAGVRTVEDGEREIEKFKQQRNRNYNKSKAPVAASSPLSGENVVPKNEEEAKAYERFRHL